MKSFTILNFNLVRTNLFIGILFMIMSQKIIAFEANNLTFWEGIRNAKKLESDLGFTEIRKTQWANYSVFAINENLKENLNEIKEDLTDIRNQAAKKAKELLPKKNPKYSWYFHLGLTNSLLDANIENNSNFSFDTESVRGMEMGFGYEKFIWSFFESWHISGQVDAGFLQKGYGVMAYQGLQILQMNYGQIKGIMNFSYKQFVNMGFGLYHGYLFSVSQKNTKLTNDYLYTQYKKYDIGFALQVGLGLPIGNSYIFFLYSFQKSFNAVYETLNGKYKNESQIYSLGIKKVYY